MLNFLRNALTHVGLSFSTIKYHHLMPVTYFDLIIGPWGSKSDFLINKIKRSHTNIKSHKNSVKTTRILKYQTKGSNL